MKRRITRVSDNWVYHSRIIHDGDAVLTISNIVGDEEHHVISREMLADRFFPILLYLRLKKREFLFLHGDGTGQPVGFLHK